MTYKIMILALGNDLLGDDGLALEASSILRKSLPDSVEIEDVFGGGLELLDLLEGKDKVLILDSIITGKYQVGEIIEINPGQLSDYQAYSPHYIGLPDVLRLSKALDIGLPNEIKILCMEIPQSNEIKQGLSLSIQDKLPGLCSRVENIINEWLEG